MKICVTACRLRHRMRRCFCGRLNDKWHLDEAVVPVHGKKDLLWRAVDQDGSCAGSSGVKWSQYQSGKPAVAQLLKGKGRTPRLINNAEVRSCDAGDHDLRRSLFALGIEQSGGEVPLASPAARAKHEMLRVTAPSATLHLNPWLDCQPVPHPLQPPPRLAFGGDGSLSANLSGVSRSGASGQQRLVFVKFTMPCKFLQVLTELLERDPEICGCIVLLGGFAEAAVVADAERG